jgi:hypothetical protein
MKRYLAKLKAHGAKKTRESILHFESFNDARLMKNIISKNRKQFHHNKIRYMYTQTKAKAIKNHQDALERDHNITTLVDMDYDLRLREHLIEKGKPEKIPRLHSTKPACTLLTVPYNINGKFKFDEFCRMTKRIPELSKADEEIIIQINENAIKKTWERILKARPYARKMFEKKGITSPLNDHSVVEAILEQCNTTSKDKIKQNLEEFARLDNETMSDLILKLLSDFNAKS